LSFQVEHANDKKTGLTDQETRYRRSSKAINQREDGILHKAQKTREKIQTFSLAKECYSMRLDLLTNATVVDDAMRFISEHSKSKHESNNYQKEEMEREEHRITNKVF
jgi:hypothetical protein